MKSLKRLFRSTSPDTLQQYFDHKGATLPDNFDWSMEDGKRANEIEKTLATFAGDVELDIRAELEFIEEIATGDGWTAIAEVCDGAGIDVPEDGGAEDAAFFVALNYPKLLPKIVNAASMNRYSGGRQWGCFLLDGASFASDTLTDPDAQQQFIESMIVARKFPKSRPHDKDWFSAVRRDPVTNEKTEITYLTLYVLDRPIKEMTVNDDNRFLMALRQRVDEMIFAINPSAN